MTPLADALAVRSERSGERPRSIILLWLQGGASQLETFDPHPDSEVSYGAKAIRTALPGVLLGEWRGAVVNSYKNVGSTS